MNTDSEQLSSPDARWYCVRSKPKQERMAVGALQRLPGIEVYCPFIRFQRNTKRGKVWFQEAMFPGYLFARFDLGEQHRAVAYSPGVLNMLKFDGIYMEIPEAIIGLLRDESGGSEKIIEAIAPFEVGEETTILDGGLRGLKVIVTKLIPAKERVRVLMELLGTVVEAEFPESALEHRKRHPMAAV
ncbi:MAG: hypothetical protein K9M45_04115 [Kiritimatiellales bacterium]|nr:hypothetical protein [Kiritimatiellales bacterium]